MEGGREGGRRERRGREGERERGERGEREREGEREINSFFIFQKLLEDNNDADSANEVMEITWEPGKSYC